MIIDAHCHLIPSEEAVKFTLDAMALAGVDYTILVPGGMIPPLGMADFLRGRLPLITTDPPNDFVLKTLRQHPARFGAFFQVDPGYHDEDDLKTALEDGFSGFKLNPLVNKVAFAHRDVDALCAFAQSREIPIYTHIVAQGDASLDAFERLVVTYDRLPFILGHMGFAATDESAIRLAQRCDNLFLETSIGSILAIREALSRLGPNRIIFGSEGPVHHPAVELFKLRLLNLSEAGFDRVCGENIQELTRVSVRKQEVV